MRTFFVRLSLLSVIVGVGLVGCDKPKSQVPKDEPKTQNELQVVPLAVSCDDASVKNALVRQIGATIDKQVSDLLEKDDKKEVLSRIIQSKLSMLYVDLQDVQTSGTNCQARVLLAVSNDELLSANRYFAKKDVSLEQLMKDAQASVQNGYLTSLVDYSQTQNAVSLDDTTLFALFAKILRADAITNADNKTKVNINGIQPTHIEPLTPVIVEPVARPRIINIDEPDTADNKQDAPQNDADSSDVDIVQEAKQPAKPTNTADTQTQTDSNPNKQILTTQITRTITRSNQNTSTIEEPKPKKLQSAQSAQKPTDQTVVITQTDQTY